MTFRILVTDGIDRDGVALLAAEPRLRVDVLPTLSVAELLERIGDYDAFVGRSATRVSEAVLGRASRLRVIGRAGVGIDNIALNAATSLGIAVINAPAGNTAAVAELLFGALIGLLRHLARANTSMHAGGWDRSDLLGHELRGRTIGIVGIGRIGSAVAVRAHAFGMPVIGYDPYVGDERFATLRVRRAESLDELVAASDVLTVHTPLTDETRGLIGHRELAKLPAGSVVANLARGGIVDEDALAGALVEGQLFGAVIDVYASEPLAANHALRHLANVLLTPHIGASTAEAQRNVAIDVCAAVRDALLNGELSRSLNAATIDGGHWSEFQPALLIARRAATVAQAILAAQGASTIQRLMLRCGPQLIGGGGALLAAAAVGTLERILGADRLNAINARALAEARGVELSFMESAQLGHPAAVEISLHSGAQELTVVGVAHAGAPPRLTRIGEFHVDVALRQTLVILSNRDVPGVIGRVGTLLADAGVNIAEYHQARLAKGGEALAAISVDGEADDELRRRLLDLPDVHAATIINFLGA